MLPFFAIPAEPRPCDHLLPRERTLDGTYKPWCKNQRVDAKYRRRSRHAVAKIQHPCPRLSAGLDQAQRLIGNLDRDRDLSDNLAIRLHRQSAAGHGDCASTQGRDARRCGSRPAKPPPQDGKPAGPAKQHQFKGRLGQSACGATTQPGRRRADLGGDQPGGAMLDSISPDHQRRPVMPQPDDTAGEASRPARAFSLGWTAPRFRNRSRHLPSSEKSGRRRGRAISDAPPLP